MRHSDNHGGAAPLETPDQPVSLRKLLRRLRLAD